MAYCGPVLVDHRAAFVDQIETTRRSGRSRSASVPRSATSTVEGSERRNEASRTHGDSRSFARHASRSGNTSSLRAARRRCERPRRPTCAGFRDGPMRRHWSKETWTATSPPRSLRRTPATPATAAYFRTSDGDVTPRSAAPRRLDVRTMEAAIGRDGHRIMRPLLRLARLQCDDRAARGTGPGRCAMDPAPSVITTSPGRATRASAAGTSASIRHDVDRRRRSANAHGRQALSSVTPGIGSSPAPIDVGQHDVVGAGQRRAEAVQQRRASA